MKEINGVKFIRYEHFHGKKPMYAKNLHTWGEAGTVKIGKNGKIGDHGITMIFVGYSENHPYDCYRMYNPETSYVHNTRDIIWLS